VAARLAEMAQDVPARDDQTPQALGALQRADMAKWLPIVKTAAAKSD